METPRTILRNLKNLQQYLSRYPQSKQPAAFEYLITRAFSNILHLPFYSSDNDDPSINHRVVWNGNVTNMTKSPNGADGIAYANDFFILIEASLKRGSGQWRQEFGPFVRHVDEFIKQKRLKAQDVYGVLLTPKLHIDTYRSIRHKPEFNFIILETSHLIKILETSILACTIRHLELRQLFNKFSEFMRPQAIGDFLKNLEVGITTWQKDVLATERRCFVGIKSYEVIRKIGRPSVHTSEILKKLQRHPIVNRYVNIIGEKIAPQMISEALLSESLAVVVGKLPNGEEDFYPISIQDFKHRINRIITIVENVN
jgi:hypothetical protein